jgi:hypothetical protein
MCHCLFLIVALTGPLGNDVAQGQLDKLERGLILALFRKNHPSGNWEIPA